MNKFKVGDFVQIEVTCKSSILEIIDIQDESYLFKVITAGKPEVINKSMWYSIRDFDDEFFDAIVLTGYNTELGKVLYGHKKACN